MLKRELTTITGGMERLYEGIEAGVIKLYVRPKVSIGKFHFVTTHHRDLFGGGDLHFL